MRHRYEFADWLTRRALRLAQPDVARTGITEAVAIAQLASAFHVPIAFHHSVGLGIALAAGIHVSAATVDCPFFEFQPDTVPVAQRILRTPIDGGPTGFAVPTGPGLGIDVDVDVIVFATGFDAMTGALRRIDIKGRDGVTLRDVWDTEGPTSYLGLMVAGFPNLFIVQAPGSPSAATNFIAALEQHVEWIAECIGHLRAHGHRSIEAQAQAQRDWIEHTTALVEPTVLAHPSCKSWYNGANVPGKKRRYMGYTAGIPEYRRRCDEIAAAGYIGFDLL